MYPTDDDKIHEGFCEVEAAGGLVRNAEGEYLMIYRYEKWDLPKGHREPGEDIVTCAVREVEEETGARSLKAGQLLCSTYHTYFRDDKWWLKHTWWYDMICPSSQKFIPQTEEGITRVAWVSREDLPQYLSNTWDSIRDVFREAGLID